MIRNNINQSTQQSAVPVLSDGQDIAIEAAQRDIEQALMLQTDLEQQLTDKQSELKTLRAAFDKAGASARRANQRLMEIRGGLIDHLSPTLATGTVAADNLDRTWDQRLAAAKRSLKFDPPQRPGLQSQTRNSVELPACTKTSKRPRFAAAHLGRPEQALDDFSQDAGAAFDLSVLKKGTLQQHTNCREGFGLSGRQVERLKDAVNGTTIAALERFQRETFNWDQAIKGFGPEAITQLQDAQLELRTRFPMPMANDVWDAETSSAEFRSELENELLQTTDLCDIDEAEEWLDELIYRCDEIERDITNLEGVRYLRNVRQQAQQMLDQLQIEDIITAEQVVSIKDWRQGVEAWLSGVHEDDAEDLDEEEEEFEDEDDEDYKDEDEDSDDDLQDDEDFDDELDDEDFDNEADFEDDFDLSSASISA
ncbi:MAG: hypothetical protein JWM11_6516 [Planctomycetaceae bacterium]|nr:hypothetical protein [Planctomycetaceae bacterium]